MSERANHEGTERQKQGISSFDRIDTKIVFKELDLKKGEVLFDIGCGAGDYSIKAAELVGDSGFVYALDQWEEIALKLNEKAASLGIKNIKTLTSNIIEVLPVESDSCDVCLIVMVLHGIDLSVHGEALFNEIHRILKPSGRLAIIEIKKEETSFGPPLNIRLSADDFENYLKNYSFEKISVTDLESCYLIQFKANK